MPSGFILGLFVGVLFGAFGLCRASAIWSKSSSSISCLMPSTTIKQVIGFTSFYLYIVVFLEVSVFVSGEVFRL